jgi:hypothetical protein
MCLLNIISEPEVDWNQELLCSSFDSCPSALPGTVSKYRCLLGSGLPGNQELRRNSALAPLWELRWEVSILGACEELIEVPKKSQVWFLTSIIIVTQEAEIRKITVQGQQGQKVYETPSHPIKAEHIVGWLSSQREHKQKDYSPAGLGINMRPNTTKVSMKIVSV